MSVSENLPAKYAQLNEVDFTPQARKVLVRIIQVAFPHENLPPGPYERMADRIITMAEESTWFRMKLVQGVETLSTLSGGAFTELSQADAMRLLKQLEHTDFFAFVRRSTVLEMYDDEEVWEALGYEGPSYDKGGYIDRGFNDLDWLPDPRIEEYDGPDELVDVPGAGTTASAATATGTTDASPAGTATTTAHETGE